MYTQIYTDTPHTLIQDTDCLETHIDTRLCDFSSAASASATATQDNSMSLVNFSLIAEKGCTLLRRSGAEHWRSTAPCWTLVHALVPINGIAQQRFYTV